MVDSRVEINTIIVIACVYLIIAIAREKIFRTVGRLCAVLGLLELLSPILGLWLLVGGSTTGVIGSLTGDMMAGFG